MSARVLAAIVSAVLATGVGAAGTYFVMTKSLGFHQEPEKIIYPDGGDTPEGGMGGKGGFPGGGKGGKGGFPGGGKGGKGGMGGGKGGAPGPEKKAEQPDGA
jgi:hypothetical protein